MGRASAQRQAELTILSPSRIATSRRRRRESSHEAHANDRLGRGGHCSRGDGRVFSLAAGPDTSPELQAARLAEANSKDSSQLVRENELLRNIVVRERQEEARRDEARKLVLAELDRLKVRSELLNKEIEFELVEADEDWRGTKVGFSLQEYNGETEVKFHHTGWPELNDHYRISSYCWSMYLRLLKRYVERGEVVHYNDRLEA